MTTRAATSTETVRGLGAEAAVWASAVTLLHLPLLAASEQGPDGARFVAGVLRFDVLDQAPHAPGYPLYILAGKAPATVLEPAQALAAVGAVSLGLLAATAFLLGARLRDRATGRLAAVTLPALPLLVLFALRPMSDVAGAAGAWALVALAAAGGRRADAAVLLGIGLLGGLRPSVLPLAAPAALWVALRSRPAAAVGLPALGAALWAVPLLVLTGPAELWAASTRHALGHFTKWGGSALTRTDPLERLAGAGRGFGRLLGAEGAAVPIVGAALLLCGLGLLLAWRSGAARSPGGRLVLACSAAYLAWALLAQNVVGQPRHLLPLAPTLALGLAVGARTLWTRTPAPALRALTAVTLAVALLSGLHAARSAARVQALTPAPLVRAAGELERDLEGGAGGLLLTTPGLARWFRLRLPAAEVQPVEDLARASSLACRHAGPSFVTDDVPDVARAELPLRFLALGDEALHFRVRRVALRRLQPTCTAGAAR